MAAAMLVTMDQPIKTTISVTRSTRDQLAQIAADQLGGVSMDEALKIVMLEYETSRAVAHLEADAEALGEYQAEMAAIANADQAVAE